MAARTLIDQKTLELSTVPGLFDKRSALAGEFRQGRNRAL